MNGTMDGVKVVGIFEGSADGVKDGLTVGIKGLFVEIEDGLRDIMVFIFVL
jgi:hypothetical protein